MGTKQYGVYMSTGGQYLSARLVTGDFNTMSQSLKLTTRAFASLVALISMLWFVTPVRAQGGDDAQPPPTPSATSLPQQGLAAPATPAPTPQIVTPEKLPILLVLALGFALIALIVVSVYVGQAQSSFYAISEKLALAGIATSSTNVQTFQSTSNLQNLVFSASNPPTNIQLKGPDRAFVGQDSDSFEVEFEPKGAQDSLMWLVTPQARPP